MDGKLLPAEEPDSSSTRITESSSSESLTLSYQKGVNRHVLNDVEQGHKITNGCDWDYIKGEVV